jgi:phage portal protein BeeE
MAAARRAIKMSLSYDEWNVSLAQNKGFTGGIMRFSQDLTDEQEDRVQDWIESRSGTHSAGKVLPIGNFFEEFVTDGITDPSDADWLEGDESAGIKTCMVYSVPPQIIGLGESTYSNYETAERALYDRAIVPTLNNFCQELTRGVAATYGDEYVIRPDWDSVDALQEDRTAQHERALAAFTEGAITREEFREETGRDPEPDGGVFYIPTISRPVEAGAMPDEDEPFL